jgi:hypothetical protein
VHHGHGTPGGSYELIAEQTSFQPGVSLPWRFEVLGPQGRPSSYRMQHERELHLIVVREDLTTFSHLHPVRNDDGSWSVDLQLLLPGRYVAFADIAPEDDPPITLRLTLVAEGAWFPSDLPDLSTEAVVDSYRVVLGGEVVAGAGSEISFHITKDGGDVKPEPYLGAAGHLVAIRSGDLEYLHVHPLEEDPSRAMRFMIHAPSLGIYRLFLQFLHERAVRTADFTVEARELA